MDLLCYLVRGYLAALLFYVLLDSMGLSFNSTGEQLYWLVPTFVAIIFDAKEQYEDD